MLREGALAMLFSKCACDRDVALNGLRQWKIVLTRRSLAGKPLVRFKDALQRSGATRPAVEIMEVVLVSLRK